ncbi:hypothetical protein SEA_NODIGI_29 [Gordonia phage Nodigi]|nr:hypothetical protein SEA_NODIGI_29 [Gordonia phage Nodigi]
MKQGSQYSVTAQELMDFCDNAIQHLRGELDSVPNEMWLLLESGQTIVVPGDDWSNYDNHDEWPLLLMTGPDPEWLLQWWLPAGLGGDDFVIARDDALAKIQAASESDWLAVCQRAVDEQFGLFMPFTKEGT